MAALLGIVVGLWMYSPAKKYRYAGAPTSIPYRGQKRWHTVFGLIFGLGAATWAFSGMLSMDPFPQRGGEAVARSIPAALRGRAPLRDFMPKHPKDALAEIADLGVMELEFTSFAGEPVYIATLANGGTYVVPVDGEPIPAFEPERILDRQECRRFESPGSAYDRLTARG